MSADANSFLRTFPLQPLLAAQSPRDVASALPPIFGHFQQKLKYSPVRPVNIAFLVLPRIWHRCIQEFGLG